MNRPGLRAILLVPLLTTLVLGSAALGLYVYRAVEADLVDSIDNELTLALVSSEIQLARPPAPGAGRPAPPAGGTEGQAPDQSGEEDDGVPPVQVLFDVDGQIERRPSVVDPEFEAALRERIGTEGAFTIEGTDGGSTYRAVVVATRSGGALAVALPLDSVEQSLGSLRRNLILGGFVLVGLQAAIVVAVAGAIARPVSRLRDVAHRIATGDLDAEVGPPTGSRETVALTEDLAVMLDRLRNTIAERGAAAASAEQARADMERFMADAAHELRTPLTALRGYSDLHRAGMLDEAKTSEAMGRIGSESQRLTTMVRDLLELVRPQEPMVGRVDLGAVATAAVHDLRAAHPGFAISLDLDDTSPIEVVGDAARLHQAVLNLGANAWFHTPAGTPVRVTVGGDRDLVRLVVADSGPGIDPTVRDELFQPFARADASRSRRSHDGAGLGLALVKRVVDQHGGTIEVSETAGGGATFTMVLPVAPADRAGVTGPDQPA